MNFLSDNGSGAHPAIMAALVSANNGHAAAYGVDPLTNTASDHVRQVLQAPGAEVSFVTSGTAANALALATLSPPWARVFCHEQAHIETSECGAPEFFTGGAKLTLVGGADGRIDPTALRDTIAYWQKQRLGGGQVAMVSITNATELGTLYTPDQVRVLADIAHDAGLPLHMDGARLANAVAALGCSVADLTHRAGVDALSFGGTKNGCLGVEAVVLFSPDHAARLSYLRKRAGHTLSKHRFLAAQFDAMLTANLWLKMAEHANTVAQRLADALVALPGVRLAHPVQTNQVFAAIPQTLADRAHDAGATFHHWDQLPDGTPVWRFVTSWNSHDAEITALIAALSRP